MIVLEYSLPKLATKPSIRSTDYVAVCHCRSAGGISWPIHANWLNFTRTTVAEAGRRRDNCVACIECLQALAVRARYPTPEAGSKELLPIGGATEATAAEDASFR